MLIWHIQLQYTTEDYTGTGNVKIQLQHTTQDYTRTGKDKTKPLFTSRSSNHTHPILSQPTQSPSPRTIHLPTPDSNPTHLDLHQQHHRSDRRFSSTTSSSGARRSTPQGRPPLHRCARDTTRLPPAGVSARWCGGCVRMRTGTRIQGVSGGDTRSRGR